MKLPAKRFYEGSWDFPDSVGSMFEELIRIEERREPPKNGQVTDRDFARTSKPRFTKSVF